MSDRRGRKTLEGMLRSLRFETAHKLVSVNIRNIRGCAATQLLFNNGAPGTS